LNIALEENAHGEFLHALAPFHWYIREPPEVVRGLFSSFMIY